jgi:hypothetical protein
MQGSWIRKSSDSGSWPDQVTLLWSDNTVRKRYWAQDGGVVTEMLIMDGLPHVSSFKDRWMNFVWKTTYSGQLQDGRVRFTKRIERIPATKTLQDPGEEHILSETWAVSADGKNLFITTPGQADIVYVRFSIWNRLFHAAP